MEFDETRGGASFLIRWADNATVCHCYSLLCELKSQNLYLVSQRGRINLRLIITLILNDTAEVGKVPL